MAGTRGIITGIAFAKAGITCMARILGNLGTPITQATISSITWNAEDLNLVTSAGNGTLTPTNVIFNNLVQNDPRWDKDSAFRPGTDGQWGYNFLTTFSHTLFTAFDVTPYVGPPPTPLPPVQVTPHKFQVDVFFIPVTGEQFVASYGFTPIPTWP